MARGKTYQGDEEVKLSITPLIDVTFLLLIFFMCAMKFKTLERKVAAFLPKDRGLAPTLERPEDKHPIAIELKRSGPEDNTKVWLYDQQLGIDEDGFNRLYKKVMDIADRFRGEGKDLPPGDIHAWGDVPHADVVKAIDALMLAEVTEITFRGRELVKGAPHSGRGR
jgi:biopolymer transport protein ExbD